MRHCPKWSITHQLETKIAPEQVESVMNVRQYTRVVNINVNINNIGGLRSFLTETGLKQ